MRAKRFPSFDGYRGQLCAHFRVTTFRFGNGAGNKRVIFTIVSVPIYYRRRGMRAPRRTATTTGPFPVGHYTISRTDEQQQAAAEFISASCILSQCNQVSTSLRPPPPPVFSHHSDRSAAAQHTHDFHFGLSQKQGRRVTGKRL